MTDRSGAAGSMKAALLDKPKNKTQLLKFLKAHIGLALLHQFSTQDDLILPDGSKQKVDQAVLGHEMLKIHSVKPILSSLLSLTAADYPMCRHYGPG